MRKINLYSWLFRKLCQQLLTVLRPDLGDGKQSNGNQSSTSNGSGRKLLEAPMVRKKISFKYQVSSSTNDSKTDIVLIYIKMLGDAGNYMRDADDATSASIWNKPKGDELVNVILILNLSNLPSKLLIL